MTTFFLTDDQYLMMNFVNIYEKKTALLHFIIVFIYY